MADEKEDGANGRMSHAERQAARFLLSEEYRPYLLRALADRMAEAPTGEGVARHAQAYRMLRRLEQEGEA